MAQTEYQKGYEAGMNYVDGQPLPRADDCQADWANGYFRGLNNRKRADLVSTYCGSKVSGGGKIHGAKATDAEAVRGAVKRSLCSVMVNLGSQHFVPHQHGSLACQRCRKIQ